MSMNLTCHVGKKRIDLVQTPTYITDMCLSYGKDRSPDGGMEGVRRRYVLWLELLRQEQFNQEKNAKEQKDIWDYFSERIEEIKKLKNPQFGRI